MPNASLPSHIDAAIGLHRSKVTLKIVIDNIFERKESKIRVLSLFSGCGGMDFGVEQAGGSVIFANDSSVDACATLQKYFSETEIAPGDIKKIDVFPDADVVVGGYPCQSFSMAGRRDPATDSRSSLYKQFMRVIKAVKPSYFVAENVSGLKQLQNGSFLEEQLAAFEQAGYRAFYQVINAKDYGVPQNRKRLFIVGVKKSLRQSFSFPLPTYGVNRKTTDNLLPFSSHGEAIKDLPLWPEGEFYERPHDPEGHFSWYFMSRNRKAAWDAPGYTVVANWRHVTLHPASPTMKLTWSNLEDGWKQRWDFSDEFEHLLSDPTRPKLEEARRLSWRECARIQTFSSEFEPVGSLESKFMQIGNAVPPQLAEALFQHLFSGKGLAKIPRASKKGQ